jgi:hypothetical protein
MRRQLLSRLFTGDCIHGAVIVKEKLGCEYFLCTSPNASPRETVEASADQSAFKRDLHDVKEASGSPRRHILNIWRNIVVLKLNASAHALQDCWAWEGPTEAIRDRSVSRWYDPQRHLSPADRHKALRCNTLRKENLNHNNASLHHPSKDETSPSTAPTPRRAMIKCIQQVQATCMVRPQANAF